MRKIELYCQQSFIDAFIDKMKRFSLIDETENQGFIYDVYRLIFVNEQTTIYSDLTDEEITSNNNPYIKALLKKAKIESRKDEFTEALQDSTQKSYFENISSCTRLFMLDIDWILAEKIEDKFGYAVISKDKIERIERFFIFHKISLSKDYENKWEFVKKYQHPCNAMVISDNYLGKTEDDVKNNLLPILKRIMPNKLEMPFQLTIIGYNNDLDYESFLETLKEGLKTLKYEVHLSFVKYGYHDRFIFTNYYQFSAGKGFKMFDINSSSSKYIKEDYKTVFEAISVILTNSSNTGNVFKSYAEKLKELTNIFVENSKLGTEAEHHNRLLQ